MESDHSDRDAITNVVHRYVWLERLLRGGLAVLCAVVILLAYAMTSVLVALAVALAVVLALKLPLFHTEGTVRLETEKSPTAVATMFTTDRPPMLAYQWGVADNISPTDDGVQYVFSYLFGFQTITMELKRRGSTGDETSDTELTVFVGGQPWATYHVSWRAETDGTVVDIEARSDRRFGLGSVTQWLSANYWYEALLDAQGFSVVDRQRSFGRNP